MNRKGDLWFFKKIHRKPLLNFLSFSSCFKPLLFSHSILPASFTSEMSPLYKKPIKHKLTIFLTLPAPLFISLSSFVTFLPIAVLEVGTATPWAVNSSCVPLCSLVLLSYVLTVN